jgi:hypothetical protein
MSIRSTENAKKSLEEIREKRATIFADTSDGQLTKKDKAVFWYRDTRRRAWNSAKSMIGFRSSEVDWIEEYDQAKLKELQRVEEQLEALLADHHTFYGDGPAGQESN